MVFVSALAEPITHAITMVDQMQDEVTAASETSEAFSDETLKEYTVFQHAKQAEMKEMLADVADGQIEMYKKVRFQLETCRPHRANSKITRTGYGGMG